jgi:hypothetical protein
LPEPFDGPGDADDSDELDEDDEEVPALGLASEPGEGLSPDSLLMAFFRDSDG